MIVFVENFYVPAQLHTEFIPFLNRYGVFLCGRDA